MGKVPAVSEEEAQADIKQAIAEGRTERARKGLQTFVESQGEISEFSKHTSIGPETFLEALSGANAPLLDMLRRILTTLE